MHPDFTAAEIEEVEQKLGIFFQDKGLLIRALDLRSKPDENITHAHLEFLGVSVLGLVVSNRAIEKLIHLKEGALRRLRSRLLKDATCSLYFERLKLFPHLRYEKDIDCSTKLAACVIHAVVGAIFKDQGLVGASIFFNKKCLPAAKTIVKESNHFNLRAKLQEICQHKHKRQPDFVLLSEEGPEHDRLYNMGVFMNEQLISKASARSKKEAACLAASEAIEKI